MTRRQWEEMTVIEPGTTPGNSPEARPDSPYYWRMMWTVMWKMMPFGFILFLFAFPECFREKKKKKLRIFNGAYYITLVWCMTFTNDQLDALKASLKRKQLKRITYRFFTFATCLWATYDTRKRLFESPYETRFDAYALCRSVIITYIMKYAKFY